MSDENEELALVIFNHNGWGSDLDDNCRGAAEAVLNAGYRKSRTITTAEELDALPEGSAVLDADRDVSTKHADKWHGYEMNPLDSRKFSKCGPFAVLHEPQP
jgi:hypothetical protein